MPTYWPEPEPGDIVDCRFPEDKVPGPGPKERPALVTNVDTFEDDIGALHVIVDVAYGTSQGTADPYPGEFVVKARHPGSGLTKDTKFDLGKIFRMEFDDEWFAPAAPPHPHVPPKRGKLTPSKDPLIKRKLSSALSEAKSAGRSTKPAVPRRKPQ